MTSSGPALRFFAKLRAPEGKHFIWFGQSDHSPHLEEREEYVRMLQLISCESSRNDDQSS